MNIREEGKGDGFEGQNNIVSMQNVVLKGGKKSLLNHSIRPIPTKLTSPPIRSQFKGYQLKGVNRTEMMISQCLDWSIQSDFLNYA